MGESNFILMGDGVELYAPREERGQDLWAIFSHGIGEHRGRHSYLGEILSPRYNLLRYDLRGHGLSLGPRATIDNFYRYAEDLGEVIAQLKRHHRMDRYILLGHSMGALVVCDYLRRLATPDFYPEKIFLSAPPVGFPGILGHIVGRLGGNFFKVLSSHCPPSLSVGGFVNTLSLSHDPSIREEYAKDNLCQKAPCLKLFIELVRVSKEVFSSPLSPACPAFVAYGTDDTIVSSTESDHYFERVDTSFKVCRIEGGFHELHHEVKKYRDPYIEFLKGALRTF